MMIDLVWVFVAKTLDVVEVDAVPARASNVAA